MPSILLELKIGQDFLVILYTLKNYTEENRNGL